MSVNSEQQHITVTAQPLHTTAPSHHTPEAVHQLEIHTPTPCQHPPDHQELFDPALSTYSPKTTYQPELHKQTPLNHPPINHHTPTSHNHPPPKTLYQLERNDPIQSPKTTYQPECHENTSFGHRLDQLNRSRDESIRKCKIHYLTRLKAYGRRKTAEGECTIESLRNYYELCTTFNKEE